MRDKDEIARRKTVQEALGNRIRALRAQKGLTQRAFAASCRLHPSQMGEIERGGTNVTLATLILLAKKLGTTVCALFEDIHQ